MYNAFVDATKMIRDMEPSIDGSHAIFLMPFEEITQCTAESRKTKWRIVGTVFEVHLRLQNGHDRLAPFRKRREHVVPFHKRDTAIVGRIHRESRCRG